jgi:hypothetical protein
MATENGTCFNFEIKISFRRDHNKTTYARFEVFMIVKIQVQVFWVVHPDDVGSKVLQNVSILHGVTTLTWPIGL